MSPKPPLRMTCQRQVILEELAKTHTHPTADEVYQLVRGRLPHISLGTVYRNLEVLTGCGQIQKLELGGTQKRFDGLTKRHYHARCSTCGRVDDVPAEPLHEIEERISKYCNYEITGHRLELIGLCPDCRTQRPLSS